MRNNSTPKEMEENKPNKHGALRGRIAQFFVKYDEGKEAQVTYFGKRVFFWVLFAVQVLAAMQLVDNYGFENGFWWLIALVTVETALTLSQALKLFAFRVKKGVFYALDLIFSSGLLLFTDGAYAVLATMVVLTEYYLLADNGKKAMAMLGVGALIYGGVFTLKQFFVLRENFQLLTIISQSFGVMLAFAFHYFIVQALLAFYRQFLRLQTALAELDKSKKELEKAYEAVAEVTALEERQRIAKEIHDTAGHSITTVIMQTETAKRILDKNPEEAKTKIVAANLQAKHALEELRDSVHLLSGLNGNQTLRSALESIVHESTDGTGITIRADIQDVVVSQAKHRFICNTLKEGISNGLRHGNATAFYFELKEENGRISFLLSDNGKGLNMADLQAGFGLTSMQQRAKSLGGEVKFDGELGEGFEILLTLPMEKTDE